MNATTLPKMKGLVLAGGSGTRLRPLTHTRAKQLIPIANKPNLEYVLEDLVDAGVTEIGVVISPETGEEVRRALGDGSRWGARLDYLLQEHPGGLAHAVQVSRAFLGDEPFVMYLGDNLLSGGIRHLVEEYRRDRPDALVLLTPMEDPRAFGVAVLDEADRVVRLVEKPKEPPSDLALVGVYRSARARARARRVRAVSGRSPETGSYLFGPAVHAAIEGLRPSWRGELEITEAIQALVDQGRPVRAHRTRGWWKDTGRPEDLLDANRLVLSQLERSLRGEVTGSEVAGPVVVEEGARIVGSVVRGPVHVASGARIEEATESPEREARAMKVREVSGRSPETCSYVGPYTSVGPGAVVERSEVEHSILMEGCVVRDLPCRLDSSVLGRGVVVSRDGAGPRKHTLRLVLGDLSQVRL